MTVTDKYLQRILKKYDAPAISELKKLPLYLKNGFMARSDSFKPFFTPSLRREFGAVKISGEMRGSATDRQMEEKCVQFFLRNIGRLTKEIPDWLEFEVKRTRDTEGENIIQELRKIRYIPPVMIEKWNIETIISHRALIKKLFHTMKWNTFFSREIKEKLEGPVWKQKSLL